MLALAALAGGSCATAPCWRRSGSDGFTYHDRLATPDGLTDVKLHPSSRNAIVVKGKGPGLHLPGGTTLAPPLTVQLIRTGAGLCWDAHFGTVVSVGGGISARSD